MSQRASISCSRGPTVVPTTEAGMCPVATPPPSARSRPRRERGNAGEVHAVDEDGLEVRMGGERDVLDAPGDRLRVRALRLRDQSELGPEGRRVAHVADAALGQAGREEAEAR